MDAIHPGRVRFLPPITVRTDAAPSRTAELLLRLQTLARPASRPMLRDLSQVTLINRVGLRPLVTLDQGARIIRDTATALLNCIAAFFAPEHTEDGEIGPSCNTYSIYTEGLISPSAPNGLSASPGAPLERALGRLRATAREPAQRRDPAHVTTFQHHVPDRGPQENTIPALSLSPLPPATAAWSARPPSRRPLSRAAAATLLACVVAGVLQSASVALGPARQIHTLVAR